MNTCRCGHDDESHYNDPGFYDVRPHQAECQVVGCPCKKFEWDGKL